MAICFFFLLLYSVLILRYLYGWNRNKIINKSITSYKVSVLIAMRNESKHVDRIINEFQLQDYSKDNLELIIINDHSTDHTLELLSNQNIVNLKVLNLEVGEYGKKNAINKGLEQAKGDIIITTDADCSFGSLWVQKMVSYFTSEDVKLVAGPVNYNKANSIFNKFQTLDFLSLIASGAGAIGNNNSIFCNAANMAYRKSVIINNSNINNPEVVSGDDVFLLHSIKRDYKDAIKFAKHNDAIVMTDPKSTFSSLLNQRKRWAAKSTSYTDLTTIYVSVLVLIINIVLLFLFVQSFLANTFIFFLIFYFVKLIVDSLLLFRALSFFKRKDLLLWVLPFEFFYSIYIVLIVVLSYASDFKWKGRIHKK